MKRVIPILICVILLFGGCAKKRQPLTFDNHEAYVIYSSDNMLVLHPKGSPVETLISIEVDTTSMDLVKNDAFTITGTANPLKKPLKVSDDVSTKTVFYTMDRSCIVSQKFDSNTIDVNEEVLYVQQDFIVISTVRRNIKVYCDTKGIAVNDTVNVKGAPQKIEPETIYRNDAGELEVTYEIKKGNVTIVPEILE